MVYNLLKIRKILEKSGRKNIKNEKNRVFTMKDCRESLTSSGFPTIIKSSVFLKEGDKPS